MASTGSGGTASRPPWTADARICASGPIPGPRSKPPATSAMSRNVFSMKTESIPVLPREVFAACLKGLQLPVLVAVACVVRAPACGIRSLCPGLVCWGSLDHHSRLTQATHPRPLRPGEPGGAGRHRGGPAPLSGSEARSWLKLAGGSHSCSSQHPRPATRFAAGSPAGFPTGDPAGSPAVTRKKISSGGRSSTSSWIRSL